MRPAPDVERLLQARLDEARAAVPDVQLSAERFAAAVERGRARDQDLATWLSAVRAPDLYLAGACAVGDAAAMRRLEREHLSRIGATVARIDGAPSFADEVRQEVRVHLLVGGKEKPPAIAQYAGRGSLKSWVHAVAARTAIVAKRRSRRAATTELSPSLADPRRTAEIEYLRELYREDLQAAFNEALRELEPRQRNILRMHYLDGVPLDRLASIHGTHRTTLGRWVTQACEQIIASTKKKLGAKSKLPGGAMDSIIELLQSAIDFEASLLVAETLDKPGS